MKNAKGIVTIREQDGLWIARANEIEVKIPSDTFIIRDGVKQHPRLAAIEEAAKRAELGTQYVVFNQ